MSDPTADLGSKNWSPGGPPLRHDPIRAEPVLQ
jgi:hypothetical protein